MYKCRYANQATTVRELSETLPWTQKVNKSVWSDLMHILIAESRVAKPAFVLRGHRDTTILKKLMNIEREDY
jgi:hypothetical protein